jgi:PST family polysaccharide transporter
LLEKTQNKKRSSHDYFNTDHLNQDLKLKAVRGGGISVFSQSANFVIQMAGTMILARLLTPKDFGLIAMVIAFTGFFLMFRDLGLSDATIQEPEINQKKMSTIFWISITLNIVFSIIIIAVSPLIAWFFGEPRLKLIAIVSSVSFIFIGLSSQHLALLKRNMFFFKIAIIEITATLISTLFAIIFAFYGFGYWALVSRSIVFFMTVVVGAWTVCAWRPGFLTSLAEVRSMLSFGANISGYYFINYYVRNIDNTLIGWRYGARELGFYYKAFQLFELVVNQLTVPIHSVAVASLSKLRDEPEKYLLLGPQWGKTAKIFSVFGVAAATTIVYSTIGWLHASLGRAERLFRWGLLGAIPITVGILAGLRFGPYGVAVGYSAALVLIAGPGLSFAGKPIDLKFRTILAAIWRYIIAAACAGFLCRYILSSFDLIPNLLGRLLISFMLFAGLYIILIIAIFQSTKPIKDVVSLIGEMFPRFASKG